MYMYNIFMAKIFDFQLPALDVNQEGIESDVECDQEDDIVECFEEDITESDVELPILRQIPPQALMHFKSVSIKVCCMYCPL